MKRPSFQFYPADWLRDTALRSCSTGARGLWMDMICYMHEGNPYGYLKVGNKVIHSENLSRMVGESIEVVEIWLKELYEAGVYDIDDGAICSRRMIKDENLRNIRAAGGKLGGNPMLKVNLKDKQKPTPSSSSSSSSSNLKPMPIGFDLFWDIYDKKRGKPKAEKEWLKANIDQVLLETVLEQAKKYAQVTEKQFRKDPERWIKGRHWEDEIIVVSEQKEEKKQDKQWMFSDAGIEAKAREIGIHATGYDTYQTLKQKILLKLAQNAIN